jgi:cytochrome c oxidase cbb3-type subunit 3
MSNSWSWYVIAIVALNIGGCVWLLVANRKTRVEDEDGGGSHGHEFDGIAELNNPLPAWWTWLFVVTVLFAIGYLILFPGLGNFTGARSWTALQQYEAEMARADAVYGPIYAAYANRPIPELLGEPHAIEMGSRLFAINCSPCHGSDARGNPGYPNLTDDDWIHGGSPETIVQTITNGRIGNMPPMGAAVGGDKGIKEAAQYVLSLSGRQHDAAAAAAGQQFFATICSACHGIDGKGNQTIGAPNLTDDIWLHDGRVSGIEFQIRNGRINQMPAHGRILSAEKIHLLALYVYSLSHSN